MRKIGLLDKNFAHHAINTSDFVTLYQLEIQPFQWERNIEKCAFDVDIDTIVFTDECLHEVFRFGNINKRKIAWLIEPKSINSFPYEYIFRNYEKFSLIVSHDIKFLSSIPNGRYCPVSCTWIQPEDWGVKEKKKDVSIIASNKNFTEGHALRHSAAKLISTDDRFGTAYKNVENKLEALADYRFSIVIENCKQPGFFTEKLIDSLIVGTIPIYWGCEEVDQIFDPRGIIKFENLEQLHKLLSSDLVGYYNSNIDAVTKNASVARRFSSLDEIFVNCVWGIF